MMMQRVSHSVATLSIILSVNAAQAGTRTGFYNFGHSNTLTNVVEDDDFALNEQTVPANGIYGDGYGYARASTTSLGIVVDTYNAIGAVAVLSGNVIFTSTDPGATHADVTFEVAVEGIFNLTGSGGGVSTRLWLHNLDTTESLQAYDNGGPYFAAVAYDQSVHHAAVPLGVPVFVAAELRGGFSWGGHPVHGIVNFGKSLSFDVNSFFQINTPGVTANSVEGDWLVDNQLNIPEPLALPLAAIGIFGCIALQRRRRRR
jgi:hypothetical protein